MNGLQRIILSATAIFSTLSYPVNAQQSSVQFSISPQKCVSLKEGRTCYLNLAVEWQTPTKGHYCLAWKNQQGNEKCWQDTSKGKTKFEFASREDDWLQLIEKTSGNILALKPVVVKWVYKSRQKASVWRVF